MTAQAAAPYHSSRETCGRRPSAAAVADKTKPTAMQVRPLRTSAIECSGSRTSLARYCHDLLCARALRGCTGARTARVRHPYGSEDRKDLHELDDAAWRAQALETAFALIPAARLEPVGEGANALSDAVVACNRECFSAQPAAAQ